MDGGNGSGSITLRSSFRVAVPLSFARAMATDHKSLNCYYDLLEETLKCNGIFNNASRIFNCDETGIPLNPPSPRTIHKVGAKNPCYLTGGSKTQITVLACASAAGYAILPFVIFDRQNLNPQMTKEKCQELHMVCQQVVGLTGSCSVTGCLNVFLHMHQLPDHYYSYWMGIAHTTALKSSRHVLRRR